MPKQLETSTVESLRQILAETYLLLVKTHGYHWNVVGPQFVSLHTLFEGQYQDLFAAVDDIAERIRALGVKAPSGLAAFSELSHIEEGRGETPAEDMVAALQRDNEHLASECRHGVAAAEEADDPATADLLTGRLAVHEKAAWMLRSLLD